MPTKKKLFGTFDCETDPFKRGRTPKPFIWCLYDGKSSYLFYDTQKFVNFIKELHIDLYAHNGGKFDFHYLLEYLDIGQQPTIIAGRFAKLSLGKATLIDSYCLIPEKLSAYKKDDMDYDLLEKHNRNIPKNKIKIEKYVKNDCIYLYELIQIYRNSYGTKLTLASNAMNNFKNLYNLKHKDIHSPKSFDDSIRPWYRGARVECFMKGFHKLDCKGYDIISAYPYMMTQQMPWGNSFNISSTLPDTEEEIKRSFILAEVTSKKALPVFDNQKKTLAFPFIREKLRMTGFELYTGIVTNTIDVHKIHEVYTFNETINFKRYVDHYFKIKYESVKGSGDYLIAKKFMNALYGKFASNPNKYKNYTIVETSSVSFMLEILNEGIEDESLLSSMAGILTDNLCLISSPISPEQYKNNLFNIATGAAITGAVRAMLWEQITKCETPIYCDTDSITAVDGDFEIGREIGQWELEGTYDQIAIAGKKLYAFHDITGTYKKACKGFSLTPQEIIRVSKGQEVTYSSDAPIYRYNRKPIFLEKNVKRT